MVITAEGVDSSHVTSIQLGDSVWLNPKRQHFQLDFDFVTTDMDLITNQGLKMT